MMLFPPFAKRKGARGMPHVIPAVSRHSGGLSSFRRKPESRGRNAHLEARGCELGFEGLGKDLRIWFVCLGVPALMGWQGIPRSLRSRPLALREGGVWSKPPCVPPLATPFPPSTGETIKNCQNCCTLDAIAHIIYVIADDYTGDTNFDMDEQGQELRQSMWSVRPTLGMPYFILFTIFAIVGQVAVAWHEVRVDTIDSAYDTFVGIIQGIGWVGLASAIFTFTMTEAMEGVMFTGAWLRQRYLEPLKERQRAEKERQRAEWSAKGRAELIAEMKDWDRRRRDAEARGESFEETPPYLRNGSQNGR